MDSKHQLQIIGAGFGRTGTSSLREALNILGFPCYHMTEVVKNMHPQLWIDAHERKSPPQWDVIFKSYKATVDHPSTDFYQELMEYYPDAKVILTVRDPAKWLKSATDTIFAVRFTPYFMSFFPFTLVPKFNLVVKMKEMLERVIYSKSGTFRGILKTDRVAQIENFERHIKEVQAHVPASRLLTYSVTEGWEPLCAFLNVPVPDVPFPHVNDTAEFKQRVRAVTNISLAFNLVLCSVVGAIAAFAVRMLVPLDRLKQI